MSALPSAVFLHRTHCADVSTRDRLMDAYALSERTAEEFAYAVEDVRTAFRCTERVLSRLRTQLSALTAPLPALAVGSGNSLLVDDVSDSPAPFPVAVGLPLFRLPPAKTMTPRTHATVAAGLAAEVYRGMREWDALQQRFQHLTEGVDTLLPLLDSQLPFAHDKLRRPHLLRFGTRLLNGELTAAQWANLAVGPPPRRQRRARATGDAAASAAADDESAASGAEEDELGSSGVGSDRASGNSIAAQRGEDRVDDASAPGDASAGDEDEVEGTDDEYGAEIASVPWAGDEDRGSVASDAFEAHNSESE